MKIKSESNLKHFRKASVTFFVMYEIGGELSNWGALRNLPQEASGRQAPPIFPINRGGGLFQKIFRTPWLCISVVLV